ncbi:MAG: carboxylesterase family protein [Prolixibacteraceae bacterium]|nr:carboxylesterase family protein [Prolixibacteraceae bacterium]
MKKFAFTLLVVLAIANSLFSQPVTLVRVTGGMINGYIEDSLVIYKGIPYAAPPVGELRWKPPQPVNPWDGVLEADEFALPCPQFSPFLPGLLKIKSSEDCLYLNVWTPAQESDEKLPVMVWIYGGGFALGSTSTPLYNGAALARMGVVVVSIAYRVGPLGFLAHPELSAESASGMSGNYGLLDQIAGLKWLQENIAAFGGDPDKVTIFGESAGAISVSILCASPLCKGLFRGAICQSGGNFGPVVNEQALGTIQKLETAEQEGVDFAKRMGAANIQELRTVEPRKWMYDPAAKMGTFWPVVDGHVIIGDQYKLYKSGNYNDVKVLIGSNSDEGSLFVKPVSVKKYGEKLTEIFGPYSGRAMELYPAETRSQTRNAQADIFREMVFAWPTWAWANLQTQTGESQVFLYYFNYPQKIFSFMPGKPDGAGHGSEIKFVFRNLKPMATETDKQLSEIMSAYWVNFAKTGNPNGYGLPEWPVYEPGKSTVQYLNKMVETGPVPNSEQIIFMEEFFQWKREQ